MTASWQQIKTTMRIQRIGPCCQTGDSWQCWTGQCNHPNARFDARAPQWPHECACVPRDARRAKPSALPPPPALPPRQCALETGRKTSSRRGGVLRGWPSGDPPFPLPTTSKTQPAGTRERPRLTRPPPTVCLERRNALCIKGVNKECKIFVFALIYIYIYGLWEHIARYWVTHLAERIRIDCDKSHQPSLRNHLPSCAVSRIYGGSA
jgi:hypothetical protein